MTGCWSLLRRVAIASAVLVLGWATPAFAASSVPRGAGPDPSPAASPTAGAAIPDPYPGVSRTRPTPVHITPPRTQPVTPAPVVQTPVTPVTPVQQHVQQHVVVHHKAKAHARPPRRAHHHRRVVQTAATPVVRVRRPEAPAPALGSWVFGTVVHAPTRVPDGAALAVAIVVLISGLFLARAAREMAR